MAPSTPASKRQRKRGPRAKKRKTEQKINKKADAPSQTPQQPKAEDPIISKPQSTVEAAAPVSQPSSDEIQQLLDPYPKEQLISLLLDAAVADPELVARIREVADRDVSHRKVFIHGLGWDVTSELVLEVILPFGPVEECNVVVDKATGRCKGYAFVVFGTRSAAIEALKEPQKKIKNRIAYFQLASIGPIPSGGVSAAADTTGRKIYVSNVHADVDAGRLREFFARFGEIELGPLGYDMLTGKSRGFALFVYKTQEGAKKALEEPYKTFEGHQLHCQLALSSHKGKTTTPNPVLAGTPTAALPAALATPSGAGQLGSAAQPVLAAVAAAQNLALLSQNPAYAALLAQNPLLAALAPTALNQSVLNPAAFAALNPAAAAAFNPVGGVGLGAGYGTNHSALLGAYGVQGAAQLRSMQLRQSSSGVPPGAYPGFPPYR